MNSNLIYKQLNMFNTKLFRLLFTWLLSTFLLSPLWAQNRNCHYKDTIFNFNFGTESAPQDFNLNTLKNYQRAYDPCPADGYFSFVSNTADCFKGDWIKLPEDHTGNDRKGRMMIVNASNEPGAFFTILLNGFKHGKVYEFSCWLLNVCRINSTCPPLPPDLQINLTTVKGKKIASFNTGKIRQSYDPEWKRYFGVFTAPDSDGSLLLTLVNSTSGGCGNDFAIDDIILRECYPLEEVTDPPVPVTNEVKSISKTQTPSEPKTEDPKNLEIPNKNLQKKNINADLKTTTEIKIAPTTKITAPINRAAMPEALLKRKNELIKTIDTDDGEILIELYDNGIIDGDTVSIFHNNKEIVTRAALSASPIRIIVDVNKADPIHEFIMVAENLGSIPPNTSLMVITHHNKREEVFISSSEQQNAKIIIRKKDN
jgi:hypothetical protein